LLTSKRSDRSFSIALFLIGVVGAGCESSGTPVPGDGGTIHVNTDGPPAAVTCAWGSQFPQLMLPMAEAKGLLKGMSRNASTTCTRQKGSGGPDTVFVLPVAQRTTVELEVISSLDTVVAIRTACDDPLSEVACSDGPGSFPGTGGVGGGPGGMDPIPPPGPPVLADAGIAPGDPPPPSDGRDGVVRATLNPGTYFVLVDEAEPHGVGGEFTIKLRSSTPVAHSSCQSARMLTDGVSLPAEELDVAAEKPAACSGVEARPALFYSARIPSGQRLTVRATPSGGDRAWTPVIQLLSGCANARCLARDRATMFGDRQLRYVNNGPAAEEVIVSVSASGPVSGATFRMDVSISEPVQNNTCASARPLSDGLVLRNQDLTEGGTSEPGPCKPSGGQSLYYSATLLPQQGLVVTAQSRDGGLRGPLFLTLQGGCNQMDCRMGATDRIQYTNSTSTTQTLIVEVTSLPGLPPQVFDLMVAMPLPPASLTVRPTGGLETSEAGGKDSFEVVLDSPPGADVIIPLESSAPGEASVSPAQLVFGPSTWDRPQKVEVTGVDDQQRDGTRRFTVVVKPAMSKDTRWNGIDGEDVEGENFDDEASFRFVAARPLVTSESGVSITFTAVLNRRPTADVTLPLSSSDAGEGTVRPAQLTFTAANWNVPQVVTVTGVDDEETDGSQKYSVVAGKAASADPDYDGLDPEDLEALNADNEFVMIPAQPVSGGMSCFDSSGRHVAADETGSLYVVMTCQGPSTGFGSRDAGAAGGAGGSSGGGAAPVPVPPPPPEMGNTAFVVSSHDGGKVFSAPKNLGLGTTFQLAVAGGGPGVAYVVGQGPTGVTFVRTEDGGQTWSKPLVLTNAGGSGRIAAAGRVVILTGALGMGSVVWRSEDGGRTFKENFFGPGRFLLDASVEPDGTVWLYGVDGFPRLWKSTDGGATFTSEVQLSPEDQFHVFGFGRKVFYGIGGKVFQMTVIPLDNPKQPRVVSGLAEAPRVSLDLVVDRADNLTVLDSTVLGLDLRRLTAGSTMLGEPRRVGSSVGPASGVALSESAVAVKLVQAGQVMVSVQTWP
jgi:hypothetical protein